MSQEESRILGDYVNELKLLNERYDKLMVLINALMVRIEAIEALLTQGNVQPKRSIKTTSSSTTQSTSSNTLDVIGSNESTSSKSVKQLNEEVDGGSDNERILNALAFFKKIIFHQNYKDLRKNYQPLIDEVKPSIKKNEGTEAYSMSVGNNVWKKLSADQKRIITNEFKEWKTKHQKECTDQLDTDVDNKEDE